MGKVSYNIAIYEYLIYHLTLLKELSAYIVYLDAIFHVFWILGNFLLAIYLRFDFLLNFEKIYIMKVIKFYQ